MESGERELPTPEEPESPAGTQAQQGDDGSRLELSETTTPPATPAKNGLSSPDGLNERTKPSLRLDEGVDTGLDESRASFQDVTLDTSVASIASGSTSYASSSVHLPDKEYQSSQPPINRTVSQASNASVSTNSTPPPHPSVVNGSPRFRAERTYSTTPSSSSTPHSTRTSRASTSTTYGSSVRPMLQGVLVVSSFETILNSKEAKRSPALKAAAQTALDILKSPAHQGTNGSGGGFLFYEDRREDVFEPLRLACETHSNPLMITALDAIGKLVGYGFFNPPAGPMTEQEGSEQGQDHQEKPEQFSSRTPAAVQSQAASQMTDNGHERDPKSEQLSEAVVNAICGCFQDNPSGTSSSALQVGNNSGPDTVNLQIVKALLTLVLQDSNGRGLSIHQSALLKAVRTVYNIFLLSRNPTNQMVAQGALNQIVGSVFSRVQPDHKLASRQYSNTGRFDNRENGIPSPTLRPASATLPAGQVDSTTLATSETDDVTLESEAGPSRPHAAAYQQESASLPSDTSSGESAGDNGQARAASIDTIRPVIYEDAELGDPANSSTPATLSETNGNNQGESHEELTNKRGNQVEESPDTPSIEKPQPITLSQFELHNRSDGVRTPAPDSQSPFFSLNELHNKDAYLVFRALCKLGMKPLGVESERDMKSHAMRSKLLSLHLILSILHNHLYIFIDPYVVIYSASTREFIPFIQAVKQYLLLCLSRNAVSSVLSVFELSCEIFWRAVSGMRTKLKKEIEVLLNEIFLPILEMRNSSVRQKAVLLNIFGRLCQDPQALVDFYINYDCDRTSMDNVYERLVNIVSRIGTTQFNTITPAHASQGKDGRELDSNAASTASWTAAMPFLPAIPPNFSQTSLSSSTAGQEVILASSGPSSVLPNMPIESQIKRQSLECLVSLLRSLVAWAGRTSASAHPVSSQQPSHNASSSALHDGLESPATGRLSEDDAEKSFDTSDIRTTSNGFGDGSNTADDPARFENSKHRKTTLLEGIKKFNFKPKRGITFLLETGFIRSRTPRDIAAFLLHADGLSKSMIGEYLGEGDPDSIATMHAFVDMMDFTNMKFVDALRIFLQSFRLPGEAQKIDRFMLKFAERFIAGNPSVFANADPAYILAFSTIMLNTDAHSPQIKRGRMTKAEFIKNNRGINNGQDLPEDFLGAIYDEIQTNEIRMKDEVETSAGAPVPASGLATALSTVGRDLQREAYLVQSEGMVSKTEALFRTMVKSQRKDAKAQRAGDVFFSASHVEHVRPMFEVVWTPVLAGISAPWQESDDQLVVDKSLDGFKQAIKIVCLFDLDLERNAFVTTLAKFTSLTDFAAMKPKNVEAIRCLIDVSAINGNYLKTSWREVIVCISQLERFQLITQGVDSRAVPELGRKPSHRQTNASKKQLQQSGRPTDQVATEATASHITNAADRVFSSSNTLSGTAIVDFVRALSEVSWEEIQSSGLAEHPRVFCLQKLVEISYYNMNRIRLEWSQMWAILGEHFNQVCCHTNASITFLALDSLRQLAMRFLEKQELANFSFQKDFLKPFEFAMVHNNNPDSRDMILQCMQQMLQARVNNLRSGWRAMFGVFCAASRVITERVANQAFDIVKRLNKEHFGLIVTYGSFADLAVCITDFCKISKYQKISLHAIEMLRGLIPQMIRAPECPITDKGPPAVEEGSTDDPMTRFWFPVLFGFYDIIMNGEDLEVRKRALDYLFETLKTYGHTFPAEFWDSVCKEVLFPIFSVLRSRSDVSRFSTHEDMSVWLSTTMIQALRDLVDLFTYYFDTLDRMLAQLLDLLVECICQENDTLARIGTSCLQQLLEKNVKKLTPRLWEQIVSTFVQLFQTTTAGQLFDENLRMPLETDLADSPSSAPSGVQGFANTTSLRSPEDAARSTRLLTQSERRRIFRQIIVKCVLQLLLIETAHDLLQNEEVYSTIPPADLLRLMAELDQSYRFAKRFNADKDLRMALWKVGFMKQLPNLLKQESSSAATLVSVLLRMYSDARPDHVAKRTETLQAFLPLGVDILEGYISLDPDAQARNITAWTPVVAEVLQGMCAWDDTTMREQAGVIYPLAVDLLAREMTGEIRESVRGVFHRIGLVLSIFQLDAVSLADSETLAEPASLSAEESAQPTTE